MNRWLDRGITLLLLVLLGWAGLSMLHWLLVAADWSVVATNLPLYAVGSFPADQRWRPLLWMGHRGELFPPEQNQRVGPASQNPVPGPFESG